MSVKLQRMGVTPACVPTCTTSWPTRRPISSSREPVTGLIHVTRQAWMDASHTRSVVPNMFRVLSSAAVRSARRGMIQTSCTARPSSTHAKWASALRPCFPTSVQ
jgi:hypothetical protein